MVGIHGRESIRSDLPLGDPIHFHIGNNIAAIGGDGEGLPGPLLDGNLP